MILASLGAVHHEVYLMQLYLIAGFVFGKLILSQKIIIRSDTIVSF